MSRLSSARPPPAFTDTSSAERFRLVEEVELETIVEVSREEERRARGEGGTFVRGVEDSEDSISGELSCFVTSGYVILRDTRFFDEACLLEQRYSNGKSNDARCLVPSGRNAIRTKYKKRVEESLSNKLKP